VQTFRKRRAGLSAIAGLSCTFYCSETDELPYDNNTDGVDVVAVLLLLRVSTPAFSVAQPDCAI